MCIYETDISKRRKLYCVSLPSIIARDLENKKEFHKDCMHSCGNLSRSVNYPTECVAEHVNAETITENELVLQHRSSTSQFDVTEDIKEVIQPVLFQ